MATGVDDDATLRANREGFKKIQLRARRMVDVSKVDKRSSFLGPRGRVRSISARAEARGRFMLTGS